MEEKLLKQIEQNTRRTANYLGFFVILIAVSFTASLVVVLAEITK